jgi:flagellar hook protein FlgE
MSSAYSNALSGLNANSQAINIVSSNLANLGTTGYKDQQVSFEDLVNESLGGFANAGSITGSTIAQASPQFSQGTLQTTSGPFDAAIQGGGFFVTTAPSGQQLFTRQGNFQVNASGQLVTATGQFVQGWNAVGTKLSTNGATANIVLPTTLASAPSPTTTISLSANLNSNTPITPATAATFSSPVQVFDSEGNAHTLTVTYTQTSTAAIPNTWTYNVSIPSGDLAAPGKGTSTNLLATDGTLTFDGTGQLKAPVAPGTIAITIPKLADGASSPTSINWNLYNSSGPTLTQFASASANIANTADGSAPGQLNSLGIGTDGEIVAKFSNGTTQNVAQIALASVLNPDSMQQVDGNNFAATSQTASPVIGVPSTGARGEITGGALETSTVDIATEFTNLLQYERGYQANSKVITTEDQIVQQTISLITGG